MEWYLAGATLMGMVVIALGLTIPVAFAFLGVNLIGAMIFLGGPFAITQVVANSTTSVTNFALVPVPLFLLMGELFFHTGVANRVFDVLDKLLGRIRGRLAYVTVGGGTIFAALSGSSIANTAMLGSTMLPEMQKRGYNDRISIGPIIGTGGLAILIPPSALAVLLGSLAGLNIGKLLVAGILPGLILASFYVGLIWLYIKRNPDWAPTYDIEDVPLRTKLVLVLTDLAPMSLVIFLVVGLIILGIATPSEAAAFGVLGVLIVAAYFRALTLASVWKSVMGAARVTSMVFLIILGSTTFSQILAISGASGGLVRWSIDLDVSALAILAAILLILLFLGMLMEAVSIMMLTIPIFFPIMQSLGYDPIWFGIVMLLVLEISLATPPFGLSLFVLMGVAKDSSYFTVVRAALPYTMAAVVLAILLVVFPGIVLILPSLM